ncbi:ATP-dependent DNA/RNA helicase DHX36-like [Salvelinus sp. IW2-2015]|uniref:ATP-dependent DNA/RNA helicase DHX36-like n=1 Tax=Salvelinus sp. IW2-2015 TaxID=2691554 RepID=UPI0038D4D5B1
MKALDPPTEEAVTLAITHLMDLNALDRSEALTPLGLHLARLSVEPHTRKLSGALLGCLDPVLTIAASLSFKDPFFIPMGKEKIADFRRRTLSRDSKSDHLTIIYAFTGWEEAKRRGYKFEREFCWDNFLSANTLQMLHNMKGQFAEHLLGAGFISTKNHKDPDSNINSENEKLIKAVIVAGLYPKVAMIKPSGSKKRPVHWSHPAELNLSRPPLRTLGYGATPQQVTAPAVTPDSACYDQACYPLAEEMEEIERHKVLDIFEEESDEKTFSDS